MGRPRNGTSRWAKAQDLPSGKIRNASLPPGTNICGSTKRHEAIHCNLIAGWGTNHLGYGRCKWHGGSTPNGLKQAQNLMAVDACNTYGLPVDTTATAALENELKRTAGHVAWLHTKITGQEESDLYDTVGGGQGGLPSKEASIWMRLYAQERKHLRDVAKTCHDVGIDERRVQLAEQQGQLLAQAIQGILLELGVQNDDRTADVVRKYLMQASGTVIEGTAVEA